MDINSCNNYLYNMQTGATQKILADDGTSVASSVGVARSGCSVASSPHLQEVCESLVRRDWSQ